MQFDSVPTENSTNMVNSGVVYSALDLKADKSTTYTKTETDNLINTRLAELVASAPAALDTLQELATALGNDPNFATTIATQLGNKADKSDTYTKTEVDTALSNVQSTLTFDNVPTANSDNPVKSSGIKTALDSKQNTLTFDSTPTANSTNPVTSGGVYTALQNVDANIEVDDEITEDSDNPVTSAAIWEALQNFTPSGGGESVGNRDFVITGDIGSPLIPTLSSNVGSNGEAYIGGADGYYGNNAFNAFDGDMSTYTYYTGEGKIGGYVGYRFNNPVIIGYIGYIIHGFNQSGIECNIQILDENDNWITLENFNSCGDGWNTYLSGEKFIKLPILTKIKEIRAISGVKYQGQNTMVRKLQVYSATNNGRVLSEQMYSNVLYENSSGANTGNIILSDSYKNYDFIGFNFSWEAESPASNNPIQNSSIVSVQQLEDSKVGKFSIHGFGSRSTHFIIVNDTTFNCTATENGQKISKIYGIKLAKGGYSGIVSDARMTVKSGHVTLNSAINSNTDGTIDVIFDSPMPDTNYRVFLNNGTNTEYYTNAHPRVNENSKTVNGFTISIFATGNVGAGINFDWIAIRPNSYTREGMVEDVLFSNASGVNSGTINLSGNISDYDLIQFETKGTSSDCRYTVQTYSSSCLVDLIGKSYPSGGYIYLHGHDNEHADWGVINDSTLTKQNSSSAPMVTKITGIKFGRYVSGVAVDTTVTQNSDAVVTSGAVYDALQNIPSGGGGGGSITIDSVPTENSQNAVSSGGVYAALQNIGSNNSFASRIPSDMILDTADETIFVHGSRTQYKKYSDVSAGAVIYVNRNCHAILVSETQDGAIGYSSYSPSDLSTPIRITFGGQNFYYSGIPYGWNDSVPSQSSCNVRMLSSEYYTTEEEAARYILTLLYPELLNKTLSDYNITDAYTKTEVDTLLQNAGGSSITVDSTITQGGTNPVEGGAIYTALGDKADKSTTYTKTEVDTALASKGDVTTDTAQNITGTKTFVGSKKVAFKQSTTNDKLGFTLYGNTGTERGYLEFNPTNTVDGVAGLMTLGNYATSAAALTQVGFRRYSNISGQSGAYNLLMPMVADARTPFSLTTTYQNFYLPLGFTDGTTTVRTAKSGVVDLSPLLASLEARIAALEGN